MSGKLIELRGDVLESRRAILHDIGELGTDCERLLVVVQKSNSVVIWADGGSFNEKLGLMTRALYTLNSSEPEEIGEPPEESS